MLAFNLATGSAGPPFSSNLLSYDNLFSNSVNNCFSQSLLSNHGVKNDFNFGIQNNTWAQNVNQPMDCFRSNNNFYSPVYKWRENNTCSTQYDKINHYSNLDRRNDITTFNGGTSLSVNNLQTTVVDSNLTVKEKTPMSQIVELARFNQVNHQYILVNESGPAHRKTFLVKLVIGQTEQYEGDGLSIKKAQQDAARKALELTKFLKPNNTIRKKRVINNAQIAVVSPTVTLNSLLTKMNLAAEYGSYCCSAPNGNTFNNNLWDNRVWPMRFNHNIFNAEHQHNRSKYSVFPVHTVNLKIGGIYFYGKGHTRQLARHDAAQQAITVLQSVFDKKDSIKTTNSNSIALNSGATSLTPAVPETFNSTPQKSISNGSVRSMNNYPLSFDTKALNLGTDLTENVEEAAKSPISIVYELAFRRKMVVEFLVLSETGPAHDRLFVIELKLVPADLTPTMLQCQGRGASKRLAKSDACLNMIQENFIGNGQLYAEYLLIVNAKREPKPTKVKRETIIKDLKMDPNYGQQINPVSRLIQIQQAKREAEPKFELVQELGQGRYKEYVMQVEVNGTLCQANGPNKKLAKRTASELMLEKLGFNKPLPLPGKPVLKQYKDSSNDKGLVTVNKIEPTADVLLSESSTKRRVKFDLENEPVDNENEIVEAESGPPPSGIYFGWHQPDLLNKYSKRKSRRNKISFKNSVDYTQFEMTAAESTVIMPHPKDNRQCESGYGVLNQNQNFNGPNVCTSTDDTNLPSPLQYDAVKPTFLQVTKDLKSLKLSF